MTARSGLNVTGGALGVGLNNPTSYETLRMILLFTMHLNQKSLLLEALLVMVNLFADNTGNTI